MSVNRVKNLLEDPKENIGNSEVSINLDPMYFSKQGEIIFRDVSFSHSETSSSVLENVNFRIPLRKIVLIKGTSGSGKTTLLNILSGLYVGYQGDIFISDTNIRHIPNDIYKKKVCLVSQEHFIMTGTIKENLLLGKPNATDDELIRICEMVNIYSFIETLEDSIETVIGYNGLELSTGQQQRLSIARSLLRDADIYLFDEITAALDKENQVNIEVLLKYLNKEKQKTIILVTHNPVLIKEADKIFEVDKNQVKESKSFFVSTS
ncbi:ABC transporter ATP-binding protein [Lysinibacillus sp. FJAT-14745]|uniref:ATP-binding cassette domain-containing protein n=1 Tax=Lysinibacillus sp. FJAT-14745 TaxID=1704289 RepID=UPI001F3973DF|nr:ABC transporter ATP-binding protein [Lysinibacillus sp. FJAT-14745]